MINQQKTILNSLIDASESLADNQEPIMQSAHTPGPWHQGCGNGEGSIFTDVEGQRMALENGGTVLYPICNMVKSFDQVQDQANAKLIAAAPALLKALQAFLRAPSIGSSGPGSVTIEVQTFNLNAARAAIAKATQ